ncbi:MAG: argininosuccinate lyase [Candidatus Bathyarchaeota archaeon]
MKNWLLAGRVGKKLSKEALDFLVSDDVECDKFIVEEDITGNEAHVLMLLDKKIISKDEAKKILQALEEARKLYREGKFTLKPELEDVHLNIEQFVVDKVGVEVGGKMHTGRSRNDQIMLDLRLYLRKKVNNILGLLLKLIRILLDKAEKNSKTVLPAYTHLQHAQPTTLAHWLHGYGEALFRDYERIRDAYTRLLNLNPLGACAIAGTSWPIDRVKTSNLLGFKDVQENSFDVISSRGEDAAELLFSLTLTLIHLSRLSSDIILWTTYEFRFAEIDDSYAMVSSVMPQKKNPDVAELIRGKTASAISQLTCVLELMRGLPSGYFKDLQESKISTLKVVDDSLKILRVMVGFISTLKFNKSRMLELTKENFSTAVDLADMIAKKTGLPFRLAYRVVGVLVKNSLKEGKKPQNVTIEDLNKASIKVLGKKLNMDEKELKKVLDPLESIKLKTSLGSPNPREVLRMIRKSRVRLRIEEKNLKEEVKRLNVVEEELQKLVSKVAME